MAESSGRGAQIVKKALELMQQGKARSWSHAIEEARKATPETQKASTSS